MTNSEQTPALAAALAKVQAELPTLERDRMVEVEQKNGGTYKYSYVTLAKLSEAVFPLLAKNGLAFTSMPGLGSDGKMCVAYRLLHESGEFLTGEFPISGEGGIQRLGGMITYVRRYCLAAVVGIAADEDDESRLSDNDGPRTARRASGRRQAPPEQDGAATAQRAARPASAPPLPGEEEADGVTKPQMAKIQTVFGVIGWTDRQDKLRAASTLIGRPLGSATELTKDEAHTLIEALELAASDPDPALRLTELITAASGGA